MRDQCRYASIGLVMTVGAVLAGVVGCSEPPPAAPQPYEGPTLARGDLGAPDRAQACPPTGHVILETGPSAGRFPGALAVIGLEPPAMRDILHGADPKAWYVADLPEREAVRLNMLFNSVPAVREVAVLKPQAFVEARADFAAMTAAARRIEASLYLVFGPAPAEVDEAALAGVLFDTATERPVAFIQAVAGPEDFEPPFEDSPKNDLRHMDVNYLATRGFDRELRRCVLELAAQDRPAPTTQPSPWRDATPPSAQPIYVLPRHLLPNRPARW